jgi:hypothetical protein
MYRDRLQGELNYIVLSKKLIKFGNILVQNLAILLAK